jgi:hypothetical protein
VAGRAVSRASTAGDAPTEPVELDARISALQSRLSFHGAAAAATAGVAGDAGTSGGFSVDASSSSEAAAEPAAGDAAPGAA